jgi:hypothetical protein
MLKFVKQNMENIDGIEVYPIISLLLFFGFFVGLFFWVYTYSKDSLKNLESLPLHE